MTLQAVCTVEPTELAVSVAELKTRTRVNWAEDDPTIEALLKAAIGYLERILGLAFVEQTWVQKFDGFDDELRLPRAPLAAAGITSITYYDSDNAEQTLGAALYAAHTDTAGAFVVPTSGSTWPGTYDRLDAVTVTYKAGYGAASAVPAAIKQAIMLLAADWYDKREATVDATFNELTFGVRALISPYRSPDV